MAWMLSSVKLHLVICGSRQSKEEKKKTEQGSEEQE